MRHFLVCLVLTGLMATLQCQNVRPMKKDRKLRRKEDQPKRCTDGPARVKILAQKYGKNLHLKCVVNVTHPVSFWWELDNRTLSEDYRIKIECSDQTSKLTIRNAIEHDSGTYKCVVKSNRTYWKPCAIVSLKPPLKIKIRPKDVRITTETGNYEWRCDNTLGSLPNATYSWFRKLLPNGEWRRINHNEKQYKWRIPRRLHAVHDGFDVYDMYCEITYERVTVRGPIARIVVTLPGAEETLGFCPEEVSEGIRWNKTLLGLVDAQYCLSNDENSGVAKRVCRAFPGRPPQWLPPNLKDCSSPEFVSLKDQFDALEEGFKAKLNIKQVLDRLRSLTYVRKRPQPGIKRSARLFGKDLLSTVDILKRAQGVFKNKQGKQSSANETLSSFTETASNVLDQENQETWLEIEETNPETPAELVTSLDNFGLNLGKDFNGSDDIVHDQMEKNLAFQMRRVKVKNMAKPFIFQQNMSRIVLPEAIFTKATTEAVTVVSVIYDTLALILGNVNTTANLSSYHTLSNSRIISSTVMPLGEGKFKQPVRIVLENSGLSYNESDQRRCVFWQPEVPDSEWSDEGCRLVPENTTKTLTTCECDHFTLFAVMVESSDGDLGSEELAKLEIISTVGSAISLAAVLLTIMIYLYYRKALWSARYVNLMNLCLAIALLDIFSVLRGPLKDDESSCTAIGILLHYLVLALFMWMLCEGILLCLLLTNVFKKNYGRKWYLLVHLTGWGLPAVIVSISIGVRGASSYGLTGHCWLSRSNGFIWAAMAPMIVVLLASYIAYGVMMQRVVTSQKVQQEETLGKVKATVRASIIIMPVLGFTWMFAILDFFFDQLAFKYLFAIFNSLQGLFIFIFHCLLSKQVQQAVSKKKKVERPSALDRIKTQEMRIMGSRDSLESIK